MRKLFLIFSALFLNLVFAQGYLQDADFKTEAELITAGATASSLLNDTKIYISVNGINKTLDDAIADGDIGFQSPLLANGDLLYYNAGHLALGIGTTGQLLTVVGGLPAWQDAPVSTTLDTKGQLQGFSTVNTNVGECADGEYLVWDSAEASGVKCSSFLTGTLNPVTDWASFTPTGSWANTTYTGRYSRVGQDAIVEISFTVNGAVSGNLSFGIAAIGSIDATAISAPSTTTTPSGSFFDVSGGAIYNGAHYVAGNNIAMRAWNAAATYTRHQDVNPSAPFAWASGDSGRVVFRVPIQGWTSGLGAVVQDKKLIEVNGAGNATEVITPNTEAIPFLELNDVDGAWSGNDTFTVPVGGAGKYRFEGGLNHTVGVVMAVRLWINDTTYKAIGFNEGGASDTHFSGIVKLEDGDTVKITVTSGITLVNDVGAHHISITQQPDNFVLTATLGECQTKALSSDLTTNTTGISDLGFNNLEIGKPYRIFMLLKTERSAAGSDNIVLSGINNSITVIENINTVIDAAANNSDSVISDFVASATTLTFDSSSISANSQISGNGTPTETNVRLCEINKEETSKWD